MDSTLRYTYIDFIFNFRFSFSFCFFFSFLFPSEKKEKKKTYPPLLQNTPQLFLHPAEGVVYALGGAANGLGYLLLERTTVIVDRMKETAEPTSFARDQVEYFIAYGLMTTVLRWHHYGFQSSPEEMAKEIGGLLGNSDVSVSRLLL